MLHLALPHVAVFGRKDWQQLACSSAWPAT
jgi:pantothenate synthetase